MHASVSYLLIFGILSIGHGIFAMRRPAKISESNREFIQSGKEIFFEQRRSWKAYGTTPKTDAGEVYKGGRKGIVVGICFLAIAALIYFLN